LTPSLSEDPLRGLLNQVTDRIFERGIHKIRFFDDQTVQLLENLALSPRSTFAYQPGNGLNRPNQPGDEEWSPDPFPHLETFLNSGIK